MGDIRSSADLSTVQNKKLFHQNTHSFRNGLVGKQRLNHANFKSKLCNYAIVHKDNYKAANAETDRHEVQDNIFLITAPTFKYFVVSHLFFLKSASFIGRIYSNFS